jgi:syntaxin 6
MKKPSYNPLPTEEDDDDARNIEDPLLIKKKIARQDASLDALSVSVTRLGELSYNISNEISSQNKMLDDLETDIENVESKTASLIQKTKDLVKKTGGAKEWCIILVLAMIVLILMLLILYT